MWLFNWWSSVEKICFESKNIDNTDATSSDATSFTKILADDSGCSNVGSDGIEEKRKRSNGVISNVSNDNTQDGIGELDISVIKPTNDAKDDVDGCYDNESFSNICNNLDESKVNNLENMLSLLNYDD